MVRLERNARNAPGAGPLRAFEVRCERSTRAGRSLAARTRPPRIGRVGAAVLLLLIPLAGCTTVASASIAQWRAAYDSNLFKKLSPEEMSDAGGPADSNNLFQRWLTPKSNPAIKADSPTSTQILGSDGWHPIAKPAADPVADAEFQAALKLFQQGKFEEAEKQFVKIAKDRKQSTWGENAAFYLAECQFQRSSTSRPTTASSCSIKTTRRRPTRRNSPGASTRSV